jgi:hypothetical protein
VSRPTVVRLKENLPASHLQYAFRLLDEPTRWRCQSGTGYRGLRGRIPLRGPSAPWPVPADLEERPGRTNHLQHMSAGDSKTILSLVESTRDAALEMLSTDEVEGCIKALEGFKGAIRTPSAGAETPIDAIKAVQKRLDGLLERQIDSLIDKYVATGLTDHLDTAPVFESNVGFGEGVEDTRTIGSPESSRKAGR